MIPRAPDGALPPRLIAFNLPLALIDDSVRVTARGAVAAQATVILEAAEAADAADTSLPAAVPVQLREARRAAALAEGEVGRLRQELEALESAQLVVEPGEHQATAPWLAVTTARRALLELRQARRLELRRAMTEAAARAQQASRALAAAQDADRRRSSARSPRTGELRKSIAIELEALPRAEGAEGAEGAESTERAARADDAGELELILEYAVRGARWAPSYVARYAKGQLTWTMRAHLAQQTGEDWRGVALRVSTAQLDGHSALPELAALKIGKRQQAVARRLRPPPPGVAELFADFDRDLPRRPAPAPKGGKSATAEKPAPPKRDDDSMMMLGSALQASYAAAPMYSFDAEGDDRKISAKKGRGDALAARMPSGGRGAPPPAAPPMRSRMSSQSVPPTGAAANAAFDRSDGGGFSGGYGAAPALAAEPTAQLDFVGLVMAGAGHPRRGHLVAMSLAERYRAGDGLDGTVRSRLHEAEQIALLVDHISPPAGTTGQWSHDFDYAIEAEGRVDVPSDGGWHSLPLLTRSAPATITHVAVPREATDVFRVATGENPFDAPILPGPVDVYDGDRFLVTAAAPVAAPGGELVLPLGVDPAIKLARNAEYREEITGMLRGGLRLIHELRLEVQNTSAAPIELELRERVPVPRQRDHDDITVEVVAVTPAWKPYAPPPSSPHHGEVRGGYHWKLTVAARTTAKLSATYEVRIAGKHELVGGNRREP